MGLNSSREAFDYHKIAGQTLELFREETVPHPVWGARFPQKVVSFELLPYNVKVYGLVESDHDTQLVEYDKNSKKKRILGPGETRAFYVNKIEKNIYAIDSSYCGIDLKFRYSYTLHCNAQNKTYTVFATSFFILKDEIYYDLFV